MLKMRNQFISVLLLITLSFFSAYHLVLQTYEHRNAFAQLEHLKLEKEELNFQSNILIEEVQFSKNQISLRKFAVENLGMKILNLQERIYVLRSITK